jgi:hypothetical protein
MSSTIGEFGPKMFEVHMWFLEANVDPKTESDSGSKAGRGKRD